MKISIIGAGNVGSLTAMRLAQEGLGEIALIDIAKGLAQGKAYDMDDARGILKINYNISGTDDIAMVDNSDIIVIAAGLARKPGMSREELLNKNAGILKGISLSIKKLSPEAIVIVVTNPLDLMTYFVLKVTGFESGKVFGMGGSLDAARFSNLISRELNVPNSDIEACVIGSHGEGMLPLARFTNVKGRKLNELMDDKRIDELLNKTVSRGAQIVSLLGSGSAFLAPSAAIAEIVKAIAKDEKRTLAVSSYLFGEYGIKDVCIGVPVLLGKSGIERIIELDLNKAEKERLANSAQVISGLIKQLPLN